MNPLLRAPRMLALARAAAGLPLCLALALAPGLPAQAQNLCATQASPVSSDGSEGITKRSFCMYVGS